MSRLVRSPRRARRWTNLVCLLAVATAPMTTASAASLPRASASPAAHRSGAFTQPTTLGTTPGPDATAGVAGGWRPKSVQLCTLALLMGAAGVAVGTVMVPVAGGVVAIIVMMPVVISACQ
jgi:hypothetical protein